MTVLPVLLHVALSLVHAGVAVDEPRNETDSHRAPPVKSDVIAFSAEVSDYAVIIPAGSPLVFDEVITNVGGRYDGTTGQFECPDDGLYVFIWNLMCYATDTFPGMRCIGSLRSAGIERKYGPKTSYYRPNVLTGVSEMTAVLECSTDHAVTINALPWRGGVGIVSVFLGYYNSFSGFKLQDGVAFTAELSQDQYIAPGGRIMFDNVIANHGGNYNVTNGSFRCPDDGVYVFSISGQTPADPSTPWSVSRLMMDGEVVMQGPMTHIATADYDSGSASITAVLQCTPDLSVYVEAQAAHDFPLNSYGEKLTSFTGFKLCDVTTSSVAFTAVMTQNLTSVTSQAPIPFDKVITNIGGAFDISTSRFVCPDGAHYLFTWSAVILDSEGISLYMDGAFVKNLFAQAPPGETGMGTSGSCSETVIIQCQPGSVLQLISLSSYDNFLGGYTSFSGYKIPG